ncbi:MAG: lipoate-protein ligase A [Pseudohongiellaceae bacterium]|jgi:lipoate-protein ligase A
MTTASWRLMRSGASSPSWNMGCDQSLLSAADPRPVLRLYSWAPPALSLGWFQPMEPFVELARREGLTLVRRPTGGGAIHHDREVTFCIVARPGCDGYPAEVVEAYEWVHGVVRGALAELGAELSFRGAGAPLSVRPQGATLCFEDTTALDLVDDQGRKVVGSAQRRRGGRVLHHGSIPLATPSLSPHAGSLELACGRSVTWDVVADTLTEHFSAALGDGVLEPSMLTSVEVAAADELAAAHDPALGRRGARAR